MLQKVNPWPYLVLTIKRLDKMEKLLQPLKQEGFTEEIWKSLTDAPGNEQDLLSDGESQISPKESPATRGFKRTADGERKVTWYNQDYIKDEASLDARVPSPPAAMPFEGRTDGLGTDMIDDDLIGANKYESFFSFLLTPSWLPEPHIREHLAETYFANCHVPYIVLHKPSFMAQLAAGTVQSSLVLAVCAVSARYCIT
jgi:hypothetical protein